MSHLTIGTRGSRLALWQAEFTRRQLAEIGVESELKIIKTKGDQIQHLSFDKIEGKGFFTREIEDALLRGDIDMAVHSMKDLPTTQPKGLRIAGVSYREDPADWLIIQKSALASKPLKLKENAIVGTSSARRKAQILDIRSDVQIKDIRGNVPTRIDKLRKGNFDAILLAAAGLKRLEIDLSEFEVFKLNPKEFIPAPAQGILAFQICEHDIDTHKIVYKLHQKTTSKTSNIERKVLKLLEGGCQMPVGVYCEQDAASNFHVWASLAKTWDSPLKRIRHSSSTSHELAEQVVEMLLNDKIV